MKLFRIFSNIFKKNKDFVFEIYKDKKGEWRWRLKSQLNGKIIANSGEGFKKKHSCIISIELVKALSPLATTEVKE